MNLTRSESDKIRRHMNKYKDIFGGNYTWSVTLDIEGVCEEGAIDADLDFVYQEINKDTGTAAFLSQRYAIMAMIRYRRIRKKYPKGSAEEVEMLWILENA